ncbi:MAG: site-2 protease family protein [Phycisphaerales bacterium]
MHWWVAELWQDNPVLLASWVFWVISAIVLHELAHGWAAILCGDDTPRRLGHMTINPLVHMGQTSLIMFALVGIAWGAMPVDPRNFRPRFGESIVAFAGPFMNLCLAVFSLVALVLWQGLACGGWTFGSTLDEPLRGNGFLFFNIGVMLNLVLAAFNLLPVPPLDGGRILADLVPPYRRLWNSQQGQMAALVAFVLLFMFGSEVIFDAAGDATLWLRTQAFDALMHNRP